MAPNYLGFLNVSICGNYNLHFDAASESEMFRDFWILRLRLGNSLTSFLTERNRPHQPKENQSNERARNVSGQFPSISSEGIPKSRPRFHPDLP